MNKIESAINRNEMKPFSTLHGGDIFMYASPTADKALMCMKIDNGNEAIDLSNGDHLQFVNTEGFVVMKVNEPVTIDASGEE